MRYPPDRPSRPGRQGGFTLVEIMIALTVGLMLIAGVLQVVASSRAAYRVQQALSRLQEDGRFAADFITRDIRMAGYSGCLSLQSASTLVNTLSNKSGFLYNFAQPIRGFEAVTASTWESALHQTIADASPLGGKDLITMRAFARTGLSLVPPFMTGSSADLHVAPGNGLSQSDIILVADCRGSAVTQITGSSPDTSGTIAHEIGVTIPGNSTKDLGRAFGNDAEIYVPVVRTYLLRNDADGTPGLWRLDNMAPLNLTEPMNPVELVEGVEDMQILYGEDTVGDGAADRYRAANAVSDWNKVVSVRVSLLMRTLEDDLAPEPQSYSYNGVLVTPADRRLRRAFTATIGIRNRIR